MRGRHFTSQLLSGARRQQDRCNSPSLLRAQCTDFEPVDLQISTALLDAPRYKDCCPDHVNGQQAILRSIR